MVIQCYCHSVGGKWHAEDLWQHRIALALTRPQPEQYYLMTENGQYANVFPLSNHNASTAAGRPTEKSCGQQRSCHQHREGQLTKSISNSIIIDFPKYHLFL